MCNTCEFKQEDMFVNLHLHTSRGSLLDALSKPEDVVRKIATINQKSVAFSEHGTTMSATQTYKLCKDYGLKHIYGCEFYMAPKSRFEKDKDNRYYHLTVLARNEKGRLNINKLVSLGYIEGMFFKPRIDFELLERYKEGLIILSGCMASVLQQTLNGGKIKDTVEITEQNYNNARGVVKKYRETFGNSYYLEIQSHRDERQRTLNRAIVDLAKELNIDYVCTSDSHFVEEDDLELHSIFIQIGQNREPHEDTYKDTHIQTQAQAMEYLLPTLTVEEAEIAVRNTLVIANQCNSHVPLSEPIIPHIKIPSDFKTEDRYLESLINKGWVTRNIHRKSKEEQAKYKERVKYEMNAVEKMGFSGYFLLVESYANSVYEKGTARGSGAGSLINYLIGITEVDPIPYDLYFERFIDVGALDLLDNGTITKKELKIPDIDLDFSPRDRDKIIENITNTYGKERFASLGQFGYIWSKSAIKDVGRVLNIPFEETNKMTQQLGNSTISYAREVGQLSEWFEKYPKLFEYAEKLEGIPKSFGVHPCGRVISIEDINHYASVVVSDDGEYVIQGDMHDSDDLGLVKIDTLSIASLTCIYDCLKMISKDKSYIDTANLNFADEKILDLFKSGQTEGVFQFSSNGMRDTLRLIKPTDIEDLTVANALFRPSSMKFIEHYAKRKNGEEEAVYLHDDLKEVLGSTYGIFVFQEQLITLGRIAGMRNPDKIRKATSKKKVDLMRECREELFDGLSKRGWKQEQLNKLWDIMLDFSNYSFNKSHALSYSIIAFQMAKLKVYHPVEFMTALLNVNINKRTEVSTYVNECKRMGIQVLPPDINKSQGNFTIEDGKIRFGLIAIKGVGEPTMKIVNHLRDNHFGSFTSLEEFLSFAQEQASAGHIDMLPTDAIINFIKSGMFGPNKNEVLMEYANMTYTSLVYKERQTIPQPADFKKLGINISDEDMKDKKKRWQIFVDFKYQQYLLKDDKRRVKHINDFAEKYITDEDLYEFHTMACYLTVSPFDNYLSSIKNFYDYEDGTNKILIVGTILEKEVKKSSRGGQYAKLTVVTPHGVLQGKAYSSQYAEYKKFLDKNEIVVMLANRNKDEFILSKLKTFEQWKEIIERKKNLKLKQSKQYKGKPA